jgi:hypothetical protein
MTTRNVEKDKITAKRGDLKKNKASCKNSTGLVLVAGSRFELLISGSLGASELL